VVNQRGLSAFDLLRSWRHDHAAVLCAFDLIELDGKLRGTPIEERKQALAEVLCREGDGIVLNVHYDCDAKLSSSTPARSATRALCRSGSAHRTAPAGSSTGSRSRTRFDPHPKKSSRSACSQVPWNQTAGRLAPLLGSACLH
jgi:hypothetical protein